MDELKPVRSSRFKRDVKRAGKRGRDLTRLRSLLESLIRREPLPASRRDHRLHGDWKGYREVHAGWGFDRLFAGMAVAAAGILAAALLLPRRGAFIVRSPAPA